jgi:tRNA(fMet)-specific endonuclease VapC
MEGYLLDTCICAFILRKKYGIKEKLDQLSASQCFISEVTFAELKYGAYKSGRAEENLTLIENMLSKINIVPFVESIDFYAKEKTRLTSQGLPIDDFDLLIAAAAQARNLVLVTDNLKHFQRIDGITIENWVKR